jgi:hypothetical protein
MMANRRGAVFSTITWYTVPWSLRRYTDIHDARVWCRANAGVERADWEYQSQHGRFRFRDQDAAVLFQLTWC